MKTPIQRLTRCLISALLTTVSVGAATYTWTGTVSSEWSDPANWNPGTGVPGAADTAIIHSGAPAISDPVAVAQLEVDGGSLGGAGTLTVTNALVWNGASSMAGGGVTVIGSGAIATLSGTGDRSLASRTLINAGTIEHTGTCRLTLSSSARVENQAGGLVDVQGDLNWAYTGGDGCSVLNAGIFRKSAGTGTSALQGLTFDNAGLLVSASGSVALNNTTFNNTGEVRVDTGELILAGEGSSSGRLITTNDTTVIFQSGSPHLLAGAQCLGTGWYRIRGGTVAFDGVVALAQLELNGGHVTGAGTLTVTNALVWNGGSSMTGGGTTVIGPEAIATLSGTGDRSLAGRTLINQGTIVQPGPCRLTLASWARVENQVGALVDWQGDVGWEYTGGDGCSVDNAGTFRKSGGTGTSVFHGLVPHNTGRMEVQVGTIGFPNGVVATGTFAAAEGALIRFQHTCTLTDVTLSGPGEQRLEDGTYTVVGSMTAQNLRLVSGTWQGTNTFHGLLVWAGGNLHGGTTTISPQSTLRLVGAGDRSLASRTLINAGTIEHTGTCRLTLSSSARVENQAGGLVDVQGDLNWAYTGGDGCSVLNAGIFRKSAGTGTSVIQGLTFDNPGMLGGWEGILHFTTAPSLSPTTSLEFGLTGTTHPDGYGRITCDQPVSLAGRLVVVFRNGFVPGEGQRFDVVIAPTQGVFHDYAAPPVSPSVFINPVYRTEGVSLVTTDATPSIRGLARGGADQAFRLSVQGIANQPYIVVACTDFTDWVPLATNRVPASTVWEFIDVDSTWLPQRFYRVLYQP